MRMLLGCQFQWYLTRITWHLRLTLLCFSTAVNKVRCYRCPPRSNLLSNFCESDFGKQGLFNTTNECAYFILVWDILRLRFRDWKHIVIDRSNNGQLLLFVTQPEVKIGEHIVFVENISIYKLKSLNWSSSLRTRLLMYSTAELCSPVSLNYYWGCSPGYLVD